MRFINFQATARERSRSCCLVYCFCNFYFLRNFFITVDWLTQNPRGDLGLDYVNLGGKIEYSSQWSLAVIWKLVPCENTNMKFDPLQFELIFVLVYLAISLFIYFSFQNK